MNLTVQGTKNAFVLLEDFLGKAGLGELPFNTYPMHVRAAMKTFVSDKSL